MTFARFLTLVLVATLGAACRTASGPTTPQTTATAPQILQPGAPGESTRPVTANQASDLSKVQATKADVNFMQGMIGHHAQALEMVELLKTRSANEGMKKLALRIEVSQEDEIKMMQEWLQRRGQPLPDPHAHHHHHSESGGAPGSDPASAHEHGGAAGHIPCPFALSAGPALAHALVAQAPPPAGVDYLPRAEYSDPRVEPLRRAQAARAPPAHRRSDSSSLGLVARREDDALADDHGPAEQARVVALLDRGVERVEIGVQDRRLQSERMFAYATSRADCRAEARARC